MEIKDSSHENEGAARAGRGDAGAGDDAPAAGLMPGVSAVAAQAELLRLAALAADVGVALTQGDTLGDTLRRCTDALVRHLDAAFARIWTLDEREQVLVLQASSGLYTHLDGPHSRVPVGEFKIGLIAAERRPHLTNEVVGDERVGDQEWAAREGMVAFAGYPLVFGDRLVGVMALFARRPLSDLTLDAMSSVANGIALGVERRRAESALRESEGQFRTLADSIPQLAWMAEADGHIFWYNRRWYEYTGTTLEEMEGWGWQKVHDPAEVGRVVESFTHSLSTGEPWEDTFPLRSRGGEYRRFLSRAQPIRDAGGNVVRWFGTNTDVEEQLRAEERLQASQQRFRTLTDAMPQLVWATDEDGAHLYYNRRWYEYTGLSEEESLGFGFSKALHPDDEERTLKRWERAWRDGASYEIEYRLYSRPQEQHRWFLGRATPVRDGAGNITQWVGTCTDIEEKKQMEALLARLNDERERLLEEVSTPVVPVLEGVLVMPLIGSLDSARMERATRAALEEVARTGARSLIIDITGARIVDSHAVANLSNLVGALRLVGAEPLVTGVGAHVAQNLIGLGLDLQGMRTHRTLAKALDALPRSHAPARNDGGRG